MTAEEFAKTLIDSPDEILPKGTDPQTALGILAYHFLGEENCVIQGYPASNAQWNSEVVCAILKKYPAGKIRRIYKKG